MSHFLFTYRAPDDYSAFEPETVAAWAEWFASLGSNLVDPGQPVGDARQIGACGVGNRLGGFSVVAAEDLDAAAELAKGCPGLQHGFGVEVGTRIAIGGEPA